MEETAISSAEQALVTARKSRTRRVAAPAFPSKAAAAAAAGRPAETSAGVRILMSGSPRRATAASPRVVANVKGIANLGKRINHHNSKKILSFTDQAKPPRR